MSKINPPNRLYGRPFDEQLWSDPAELVEHLYDPDVESHQSEAVEIEEWTVVPSRDHLPAVDGVLDYIAEWVGDNGLMDEWGYETVSNACGEPEVKKQAERLLNLIASKMRYWMGDKVAATHKLSWDVDGSPLLDGEPIYAKSATK